jgi:hypothetical protein
VPPFPHSTRLLPLLALPWSRTPLYACGKPALRIRRPLQIPSTLRCGGVRPSLYSFRSPILHDFGWTPGSTWIPASDLQQLTEREIIFPAAKVQPSSQVKPPVGTHWSFPPCGTDAHRSASLSRPARTCFRPLCRSCEVAIHPIASLRNPSSNDAAHPLLPTHINFAPRPCAPCCGCNVHDAVHIDTPCGSHGYLSASL